LKVSKNYVYRVDTSYIIKILLLGGIYETWNTDEILSYRYISKYSTYCTWN